MEFIGRWLFHSVGVMGEDGKLTYMDADGYINSPMPYVDENDAEAVESELDERKMLVGSCFEVCGDGSLYMLFPIPDGVTQEEIDEAVEAGEISLRGGMMVTKAMPWEIRDGKLWFDSGIEGEVFGEEADPWTCAIDENGFFRFMTTRYVKEEI